MLVIFFCYIILSHFCPSLTRLSRFVDYRKLENSVFELIVFLEHSRAQMALSFLHLQLYHRASDTFISAKVNLIPYFSSWDIWWKPGEEFHVTARLAHVCEPQGTPAMSGDKPGFPHLVCVTDFISSYSLTDSSQENIPSTSYIFSPISVHTPVNKTICEAPTMRRGRTVFHSPSCQFLD